MHLNVSKNMANYLGGAVDVIRILFVTRSQSDVSDVLHRVGQSQQHLTLLQKQEKQNKIFEKLIFHKTAMDFFKTYQSIWVHCSVGRK